MSDKSEFQQRVESELRELEARIEKYQAKTDHANAEAKVEYEETLQDLRKRRDVAQTKLNELKSSTDEAWKSLRGGVESAWSELKTSVENAATKFN